MKKFLLSFTLVASLFGAKIIDQSGYESEISLPVKRIAVMQHHSLDILAQLKSLDKVIALEEKYRAHLGEYFDAICPQCRHLPTAGGLSDLDVEKLAALRPDVIIAAAQANKEQIKKLRNLGLKVVVLTFRKQVLKEGENAQSQHLANADYAYTEGLKDALFTLAKLVGKEKNADEIWRFAMDSRQLVEQKTADLKSKKRLFIANPNQMTYGNDKYVGLQALRAAAVNVASDFAHGYSPYNFEQLLKSAPDFIIIQDRYKDLYESFLREPKYQILKAVREKNLILAPFWSKPWGNPDTDSIALGELWMASVLYPDLIDQKVVKNRRDEFYKRFYGVNFSELFE